MKKFDLHERLIDFAIRENDELISIFVKSLETSRSKNK